MTRLGRLVAQQPVFAFNIDDWIIWRGVAEATEEGEQSVIVQLSPGEEKFWGMEEFVSLVRRANSQKKCFFLNLDHGQKEEKIKQALSLGFDMVHFDGSALSWEENLSQTKKIVRLAHQKGVLVEGEFGEELTDPFKAREFVRQTGVDFLAVFVGNQHGFQPEEEERLDFFRLRAIKDQVGKKVFLTLHGGSGVRKKDLKRALKEGLIRKVNINSQLRWYYYQTLKKGLKKEKEKKVYRLLAPVQAVIAEQVKGFLKLLR